MKTVNDEILNKLIDNELNSSEINELHKLIKENDSLLSKTKAHQMVDSVLKKLELETAPEGTTDMIMKKISESVLKKERKNGFYKFIMGGLVASAVLAVGFVLSSNQATENSSSQYLDTFKTKVVQYFTSYSANVNSDLLLIITSALTVIVLISGYFIFEEHKSFKQKLDSIL